VGGTEQEVRLSQVPAPEPGSTDEAPDAVADTWLYRDALGEIRAHFREDTWRAFWMTTVDGRPPADVGLELGMTAGAVRVAKSRVLARLRGEFGDLIA
jgi:RNA polymerase sigma-70 factor (ECF subfamily)